MAENHTKYTTMTHSSKEKPIRNTSSKFSQQEVDFTQTPLFFPKGFEKPFLAIYFISLPYIAGLMFQFFYISNAKIDLFLSLNEKSLFILTWAIGYEIIAALMLVYIVKMSISFATNSLQSDGRFDQSFRRP